MRIKKVIIKKLLILGFCLPLVIVAQDQKSYFSELMPPSPTVAELGKYGEVPVGKYNGTANVGVPIHQISFQEISIPINLSYNTGGIKVSQEASWVGLGWNLSANAVISRQIKGFDDLSENGAKGFLFSKTYTFPLSQQDESELVSAYAINPIDIEPDVFTVSLFGQSIQFILPKKNSNTILNATVLNNANTKVLYDTSDQSFEVINSLGYHFFFESKEYTTQYRSPASQLTFSGVPPEVTTEPYALGLINYPLNDGDRTLNKITAWHVDRIEAPFGQELFFEYDRGYHFSYPSFSEQKSVKACYGSDYSIITNEQFGATTAVSGVIIGSESLYLEKIHGDFGSVDFGLTERQDISSRYQTPHQFPLASVFSTTVTPKKLSSVTIKDYNGNPTKSATLTHSYFNEDKNLDTDQYKKEKYIRLKLDSISIEDKTHSFEYISPNQLPAKDTRSEDFWGFYNGKQNAVRIPSFGRMLYCYVDNKDVFMSYEGADRSADIIFGKIGLLEKITYPTKGYASFEYESNTATIDKPIVDQNNPFVNSTDFSYNYQYLKRTQVGAAYTDLNNDEIFTVNTTGLPFDYNFEVSATIVCGYQCNYGADSNQYVYKVENVDNPSQFYEFLSYGRATPSQGSSTISDRFSLPNGTYRLIFNQYVLPQGSFAGVRANESNASYVNFPEETSLPFEEFEVGGARIKSIVNKDHTDQFISKKTYTYTEGRFGTTTSSGILMNELVFHSKYGLYDYTPQTFNAGFTMSSGSPLSLNYAAQGNHVGYSFVEEKNETLNQSTNGVVRSNFRNFKNQHISYFLGTQLEVAIPFPDYNASSWNDVHYGNTYLIGVDPISYDYKNGTLFSQETIDVDGNTKVFSTQENVDYTLSSEPITLVYLSESAPNVIATHRYFREKQISLIDKKETFETYHGDLIKTKELHTYNERYLKESVETTSSKDDVVYTNYTYYPFDTEHEVSAKPYMQDLVDLNRVAIPVLSRTTKNTSLISERLTVFDNFLSNSILPKSIQDSKKEGSLEDRFVFLDYDDQNHPLEVTQADGTHSIYIWGYNNQYPIAKITNTSYTEMPAAVTDVINQIKTASNAEDSTEKEIAMRLQLETLRLDPFFADAQMSYYTYDPMIGVTSMTDPRGYTMTYHYDEFNCLKYIKDQDEHIISKNEYNYKNN